MHVSICGSYVHMDAVAHGGQKGMLDPLVGVTGTLSYRSWEPK